MLCNVSVADGEQDNFEGRRGVHGKLRLRFGEPSRRGYCGTHENKPS